MRPPQPGSALSFTKFIGGLVPAATSLAAQAQTVDRVRLDSLFGALAKHEQGMGSVAVALLGRPLYTCAVCRANDQQVQATPETRYRIGSISKVLTIVFSKAHFPFP